MWLFCSIGFYSVVAMGDDPSAVMVRGRVKKDMQRLQDTMKDLGMEPGPILQWPGRDYAYRLLMLRDEWSAVLFALGRDVAYPNFKRAVDATDGPARASLYSRVWGLMLDAERTVQD